ncbi:TetR family transcriptional regulator [Longispora fulva]|uniref:AcrR family transcriptional regulator n=1 Tax=Longispora fulva TaxID=619741 RepID=A0A8J7KV41_9ACTN|nr:TetR family transcriptional regulator [Longispora fulva]MBG6134807.1 AcrR family transcriptional regulator [Longispora fulva]GIG56961.1 TetR family transcriptional regulator [Longispora fulva]
MVSPPGFQRARRPEQVEARRCAILDTARAMLRVRRVADISLRELSDTVGLAKSNVLRYFDSREAIFLEVMDENWTAWLDDVSTALTSAPATPGPYGRETRVATVIAGSLVAQPGFCELVSVTAGVLEKNISVDVARTFKTRAAAHTSRLAGLVRAEVPHLDDVAAGHFAHAVFILVAGLWPYAVPTEAVSAVMAEMRMPPAGELFARGLTEGLVNQLVGLSARATAGAAVTG